MGTLKDKIQAAVDGAQDCCGSLITECAQMYVGCGILSVKGFLWSDITDQSLLDAPLPLSRPDLLR